MGNFDESRNEVMRHATKNPADTKERQDVRQAGSLHQQPGAATPLRKSQAIASTSAATAIDPVLESVRIAEERYEAKKRSQKFSSREHSPTL